MGEKAATNEVIKNLLEFLDENYDRVGEAAFEGLEKLFTSLTLITELDSDTVLKLLSCLDRNLLKDFRFVSPEVLIKAFVDSKSSVWLSIATRVTLLQGVGVTVTESTIVVYGSKEPVELDCSNRELIDQLVNAFMEQTMRLDLPCTRPTKVHVLTADKKEFLSPSSSPSPSPSSVCSVL
jgi:hypothetical protein